MKGISALAIGLLALVGIALFVGFLVLSFGVSTYNRLVKMEVEVDNKWADVETQYQRRFDLIPNVVATAQGYAQFEKSTLTQITALRSQWGEAKTVEQKDELGQGLGTALGRLMVVIENYPELQSIQVFKDLIVTLEGTENRISVARMDYNNVVKTYNTQLRVFPANIIAGMFGFQAKPFFEAQNGAEEAPKVNITIT